MRFTLLVALLTVFAALAPARAQVLFLVRHAERADAGGPAQPDPELSAAGRARAAALATELHDAKIGAIYVTEFRRTQETAQPLAKQLNLPITVVPAKDTAQLVEKLRATKTNALVVGHSNTLPEILRALGIANPPQLGEHDYDNLFLLVPGPNPQLVQLHAR